MTANPEYIALAVESAQFTARDLRAAMRQASPVEVLVLEQLIEAATTLALRLARFRDALASQAPPASL